MSTTAYHAKRLADAGRALRLAGELGRRETWPPERLAAHRQTRLDAIVRHAAARSPYYRARLAGLPADGPVRLADLPRLDKAAMMAHFDELVCDRRLRRDALLEHLDGLAHDAIYLGEYRAMTTSGSSGRKGLFVYDRAAWRVILAQFFRFNAIAGIRPRLPRRLKIASVGGGAPTHMSRRGAQSLAFGPTACSGSR
jgi:phenylacetate-coenzyme A ligase PaaK-like adenylate-forming protein